MYWSKNARINIKRRISIEISKKNYESLKRL